MSGALLFALSALAALVVAAGVRAAAVRRDVLDHPNERSSHTTPTPRGGGLAFVAVLSLVAVAVVARQPDAERLVLVLLLGGLPVAAVGLVDDLRSLSAAVRAAVHAAAACAAVLVLDPPGGPLLGLIYVVGLVWLINLYNFMDGIDGLAAGQAVVAALGLTLLSGAAPHVTAAAWALAGATAGFLALNRPPARLFMGDVGSGYLGFVLGVLALEAHRAAAVPLVLTALLVAPFVVDATATLLGRVLRRERWYAPHREHVYQRLVQRGRSHAVVTSAYVLVAAGLAAEARLLLDHRTLAAPAAVATFGGLVVVWAVLRARTGERVPPPA